MGEDCNAGTWFSPQEQTRLNQTADLLNARTSTPGLGPWLRLRQPDQPLHRPRGVRRRRVDQRALQPDQRELPPQQARALLRLHADREPAADRRDRDRRRGSTIAAAAAQADELAAQQRAYADADAAIEPEVVPRLRRDLACARTLARAHGVDLDRWLARQAVTRRAHPAHPGGWWNGPCLGHRCVAAAAADAAAHRLLGAVDGVRTRPGRRRRAARRRTGRGDLSGVDFTERRRRRRLRRRSSRGSARSTPTVAGRGRDRVRRRHADGHAGLVVAGERAGLDLHLRGRRCRWSASSWQVAWEPSVVEPSLRTGGTLELRSRDRRRGPTSSAPAASGS